MTLLLLRGSCGGAVAGREVLDGREVFDWLGPRVGLALAVATVAIGVGDGRFVGTEGRCKVGIAVGLSGRRSCIVGRDVGFEATGAREIMIRGSCGVGGVVDLASLLG